MHTPAPEFRPDLYLGTARAYDEFRPPYPPELIEDPGVSLAQAEDQQPRPGLAAELGGALREIGQ